jgi:uncharacterized protein (TIGR02266 family)
MEDSWMEEFEGEVVNDADLLDEAGSFSQTPASVNGSEFDALRSELEGLRREAQRLAEQIRSKEARLAQLSAEARAIPAQAVPARAVPMSPPTPLVLSPTRPAPAQSRQPGAATAPALPKFVNEARGIQSVAPVPPELPASLPPLPNHETTSSASSAASETDGLPVFRQLCISSTQNSDSLAPPDSRGAERRSNLRRHYEQQVEFRAESHFFAGITQDISTGGIFVATYQLLPVGTALSIQLELPDGSELEAEGVVRWVRRAANQHSERPGIGIAFKNLSRENLERVTAFCRERPPLYMEL